MITNVGRVLLEVYSVYFEDEIRGNYQEQQMVKLSEKVLFEFLRDYDICPNLLSKSIAYQIFQATLISHNQVYFNSAADIVNKS